ncbi:programmed cell death protein 10-like isoform X1 [Mytilus galloprovincialis]|uniref:programmed cell death protein 10-like isoform X1 n=1 Tax=Mytilus edulis TaxID=6550 RepID=UPI0039EFD9FD
MTMGENNKAMYGKMILDVVIGPLLESLEKKDKSSAQTLRASFSKVDTTVPGFVHDFLRGILKKADIHDHFDICETLLRLGDAQGYDEILDSELTASKTTPSGAAMHPSSKELRLLRPEPSFQELNRCATNLKTILSRIPIQIDDRKQFLETIKEIAGSIKHLLDAFNKVIAEIPGGESGSKQILEDRKKEFVRYSKKFSNMLKAFFRDGSQRQNVFLSANFLIYQTNVILRTVKQETERE